MSRFTNADVAYYWDSLARTFGEGEYYAQLRAAHLANIRAEIERARCILDLGCGNGRYLGELACLAPDSRVVGADLSYRMLTAAHERLRGRVPLVRADAKHPPFKRSSIDIVLCAHVLFFVTDLETCVNEVAELLRPGGIMVASSSNKGLRSQFRKMIGPPGAAWKRAIFELMANTIDFAGRRAVSHFPRGKVKDEILSVERYRTIMEGAGLRTESVELSFEVSKSGLIESVKRRWLHGLGDTVRDLSGWVIGNLLLNGQRAQELLRMTEPVLIGRKP